MATLDFVLSALPSSPMRQPVIIENRSSWARILAVFWVAEVVLGLAFTAAGASWIGVEQPVLVAAILIGGLLLAAIGVPMAAGSRRIARLPGSAVEMSEDGFRDRRIAEVVTPWQAIAWKIVFNGRSYSLQFDVAEPYRNALRLHWDQRLLAFLNRALGYPEFTVVTLGTGHGVDELGRLMFQFRPPKPDVARAATSRAERQRLDFGQIEMFPARQQSYSAANDSNGAGQHAAGIKRAGSRGRKLNV